jgi:hypothetical protein
MINFLPWLKRKNGISRNLPSRARLRAATSLISLGFEAAKLRGFIGAQEKRTEQWHSGD